ncbi:MAG: type II toxin-antitoxin system YafQ family toxin [Lachnospiraceae bacterium]|jgi:mRNA interferase YafQ|nr:type II toxin-antitoxin system YafQ family toxin [Lachnospiraceae bacterium]
MLEFDFTTQFKKDYKKIIKQGKDIKLLDEAMEMIYMQIPLPYEYKEHKLSPKSKGEWEIHIEGRKSDWVLTYQYYLSQNLVVFTRTGSHSELFKK